MIFRSPSALCRGRTPGFITAAPLTSAPDLGMGPGSLSPVSARQVVWQLGTSPGRFVPPPGTRYPSLDAAEPQLSILVPVEAEEPGQPPATIPLLCRLRDPPQGWDTVRWQPGGEETPVTVTATDERGGLSAWSITWVSAERWDGAAACTALESGTNRTLSVAVSKGPGQGN